MYQSVFMNPNKGLIYSPMKNHIRTTVFSAHFYDLLGTFRAKCLHTVPDFSMPFDNVAHKAKNGFSPNVNFTKYRVASSQQGGHTLHDTYKARSI